MGKSFCALFKKDCRMLVSGKFFLMALGFLVLYTAYVNLVYMTPPGHRQKNRLWCRRFPP